MILENLNILPLICYEIIFPEFIQSLDTKTNLIINISEDAWFGGSIGPHQHFAKAIFRAVESNTILIRAANKGKSAFISNKGRVIESLSLNQAGNIELKIPIINNNSKNKNDLIFFLLLFTYVLIFFTLRNKL
jgi:apolipoprotein N-acyltransferase